MENQVKSTGTMSFAPTDSRKGKRNRVSVRLVGSDTVSIQFRTPGPSISGKSQLRLPTWKLKLILEEAGFEIGEYSAELEAKVRAYYASKKEAKAAGK